jgi:hypothetical protein
MKVISYVLYGKDPRYTINAIINAEITRELYPEWQVWFYVDSTVPKAVVSKLETFSHITLINIDERTNNVTMPNAVPNYPKFNGLAHSSKMFCRLYAYDSPLVQAVIFRDADSYPTERERAAVEQWMSSDKNLHLMRDSQPGHSSLVMGGMWGLKKNSKLKSMKELILSDNNHHTDQHYLSKLIYPIFLNDKIVHDDSNIFRDRTHDWPVQMTGDEYVGRAQIPPTYKSSGYSERFKELLEELV